MQDDPELSSTNFNTEVRFDLSAIDPVDDYLNRLTATLGQISREEINAVIDVLFKNWKARKQVFILGNGGSSTTASHMANDLCKLTAVAGKHRFKAFSLAENAALLTAWGNDTSYENVFAEQLVNYLEPGDVVIAISTSGNSPNVLRALDIAKAHGAIRIGFTGFDGGQLKSQVDYCISIPDGHMGRQEDGHLILDHIIANTLRWMIAGETE
jgi:D-sedoheptulose 7-phosphate isomerase